MNTLYVENNHRVSFFLKKKSGLSCLFWAMYINLDSAIKINSLYEGLRDFSLTYEHNSLDLLCTVCLGYLGVSTTIVSWT